jgi:transposase-like protein
MSYEVFKKAHICRAKQRELVKLFAADLTAAQAAAVSGLNINTTERYWRLFRCALVRQCAAMAKQSGIVEVDESYFGAKRVKGKRGRGAYGKTIVFGLFKRGGNVYTQIVPDCSKATLQAVIRGKVSLESVINSDGWRGYDGLVDIGFEKHLRVEHGRNEFARGGVHINGIESFWAFAKTRLVKFRGISKPSFLLHLKESEWRFNHRSCHIYKSLLKLFKSQPSN